MAPSVPPEPEDSTLRRRARRRLIGSIALVLVAVIALPMIFDEEKKPLDQDVSVQIPSQAPVIVRPGDGKAGGPETAQPAARPPDGVRKDGAADPPAATPGPAASSGPAPASGAVPEAAAAKAAAPPEPKPEAKKDQKAAAAPDARPAPKAEGKAAAPKAEEARVKAILDAAPARVPGAAEAAAGFAVQIGAFAAEDKIREAREKLGGAGFASYTEKLDTKEGQRTRVRAGPFASRDAAEAARDKIRALGFAGAVVVPK